jgi:uncharacterized protein YndB with AHSA1/START domain
MKKLFVDKSIEIEAPPSKVWAAITDPENTDEWAAEFSGGADRFHLESDWKLGSPVLWKGDDGKVAVEGNVTALEPNKLLRFTVFDKTLMERSAVTDEDGITFEMKKNDGHTTLHVTQGDFSVIKDGQKYRDMSDEVWDRVLPKVKELAET